MKKLKDLSKNPIIVFLMLLLLSISFFGFVDNKFRGWDDTNQYQLEAKEWSRGSRPPSNAILVDLSSHFGPTHVPPLTPYLWSFLISADYSKSLERIKILQACLLIFCMLGLGLVIKKRQWSLNLLIIPILVFFNEFFRDLVSTPISESLSLAILIASYIWPKFSGVGVVLEAMVRPPLTVLFGPVLWSQRKSKEVIWGMIVSSIICVVQFKSLVVPSSFSGAGLGLYKSWLILKTFVSSSAFLLFDHLLPYESFWFQIIWSVFLVLGIVLLIYKKRKNILVWTCTFAYLLVICIPFPQGVRYFVPLIVFLILEFKPQSFPKWVTVCLTIFCVHLLLRQVGSIQEFQRFTPETESSGMIQAKQWLEKNNFKKENLLMSRFRFCANYFQTICYGSAIDFKDPFNDLRNKGIQFAIFPQIAWQVEDQAFQAKFIEALEEKGINIKSITTQFDNVLILDISRIPHS